MPAPDPTAPAPDDYAAMTVPPAVFLGSPTVIQTSVSPTAFGHTDAGRFSAYADPPLELAFALCKTRMSSGTDADANTARRFERELHAALGV